MESNALHALFLNCQRVVIDSRQCQSGDLFFALQGQVDGNRFAGDALDRGAKYAVVDHEKWVVDDRYILVSNVLTALQDLACYHRQYLGIPILGLTGSNGKTTTKELVARVLSAIFRVYSTPGNYNNHIGVPLTLLGIPEQTEIAIVEMGAGAQGEIAELCAIARPDCGMITNIGKAHLEGFGGLEGVRKGKSELYQYLMAHNGLIFYNRDEPHLPDLVRDYLPSISYSAEGRDADMQYVLDQEDPRIQLHFQHAAGRIVGIHSSLYGVHNFKNIIAAVTIGRHFGVGDVLICEAIASYIPDNNRSQRIVSGTNTWVMDAYNANPTSMAMALRSLDRSEAEDKMAILGDMLELGQDAAREHQAIIDLLKALGSIEPVLVGQSFAGTDYPTNWPALQSATEVTDWLTQRDPQHTTILVKGSRGMALEKGVAPWISGTGTEPA
ncbi:MAG: UDP-N-acetylmuramoyl-tripeptide--D-alanyl-D-alanine ligase [Saprospiraceae bacterium]|nr:UDP-N-acetylmuramoyl-tripeptide--D-alanyl-D-alanine ligase [Saprospiraceae bacterium]